MITLDDARHDLDFDYDALGRLTSFTAAGSAPLPVSQAFTYDGNGNRDSITENGTPYTYSITANANRLASTTGPTAKSFTFDAAGNVTNDNIHSYGYDDRGRLVNMDSGTVTYAHNGQGQRVMKADGTVNLFVYDEEGHLIGEYDGSGTAVHETVWFNGMPVAVLAGSDKYYVHTDHLGTPRIITDGDTVIWRWESDPFGAIAAQEDPDGDFTNFAYDLRFPGQYYDAETGLHYNYMRSYDPAIGRYFESDPAGLKGGLNSYLYAEANPLSFVDPLGLCPCPGGVWKQEAGDFTFSAAFGGYFSVGTVNYICSRALNIKCTARQICIGGGPIAGGGATWNIPPGRQFADDSNDFRGWSGWNFIYAAGPFGVQAPFGSGGSFAGGISIRGGFGGVRCVNQNLQCSCPCE